jgi:hypothetical protein
LNPIYPDGKGGAIKGMAKQQRNGGTGKLFFVMSDIFAVVIEFVV